MQFIGFSFNKIFGERISDSLKRNITTNIEFTDIEIEKMELLKDSQAVKASYRYSLLYEDKEKKKDNKIGEIIIEGTIVLSASKEESKDITQSWKKKEVPARMKMFLINIILKRCTTKMLNLQEDLNLPHHIPFPKISPKRT